MRHREAADGGVRSPHGDRAVSSAALQCGARNVIVRTCAFEDEVKGGDRASLDSIHSVPPPSWSSHRPASASCSTASSHDADRGVLTSRSSSPRSCRPRSVSASSRPTSSWAQKRRSSPSRMPRWSEEPGNRQESGAEEKASERPHVQVQVRVLANMSHELRTPLNSILILGQQRARTPRATCCPNRSSSPAPSTAPGPTCST